MTIEWSLQDKFLYNQNPNGLSLRHSNGIWQEPSFSKLLDFLRKYLQFVTTKAMIILKFPRLYNITYIDPSQYKNHRSTKNANKKTCFEYWFMVLKGSLDKFKKTHEVSTFKGLKYDE